MNKLNPDQLVFASEMSVSGVGTTGHETAASRVSGSHHVVSAALEAARPVQEI